MLQCIVKQLEGYVYLTAMVLEDDGHKSHFQHPRREPMFSPLNHTPDLFFPFVL